MSSKNKKQRSTSSKKQDKKTRSEITKEPNLKNDKVLIISILVILGCIIALIIIPKLTDKESVSYPERITYNGFVFEKYGDIWVTQIQVIDQIRQWDKPYEIYFHFNPYEVEQIPSMQNIRNQSITPNLFMDSELIYITTDPKYPASIILGGVEISKIIGVIYEKEVKSALITPDERAADAPIITCKNVTQGVRIIYLKLGEKTEIYHENGCIIVEGVTPVDVLMASERLAFEMLKIM